jgi:hypothetical protein
MKENYTNTRDVSRGTRPILGNRRLRIAPEAALLNANCQLFYLLAEWHRERGVI